MKSVFTFFFILLFSFVFTSSVFAQSPTVDEMEVVTPTASPTATVETVSYDLPYPGMLPDNPLYFLKGIRDKVIEILISDPAKKSEFYLLSSDKRLNSGYFLIQKDKDQMGQEYISKSNNYLHMAIIEAQKAGDKKKDLLKNISTALKKRQEIITKSQTIIDKKYSSNIKYELDRIRGFEKLISSKN